LASKGFISTTIFINTAELAEYELVRPRAVYATTIQIPRKTLM
jgi:hypothetical protein